MTDERRTTLPRIIRRASTDFDEFAQWVEGAEILRRARGDFRAELTSADLGAVKVIRWFHTAPIIANAMVAAHERVFFVRLDGDAPVLVNGHALNERRLLDHRPGTEIRIATKPGRTVQIIKITVRPGELDRVCASLTGRAFSAGPRLCAVLEPEVGSLAALRAACVSTLIATEDPFAIADANPAAALSETVVRALVLAVSSDVQRGSGRELARDFHTRIVQRADRLLRASVGEHVPLSVLCEAVAVNRRQLQRAFESVYALGPTGFLKLRRLNLARAALRRSSPTTTVTGVAVSFGFHDLGRFANAYSALFGESPSVTLARARQTLAGSEQVVEHQQPGGTS